MSHGNKIYFFADSSFIQNKIVNEELKVGSLDSDFSKYFDFKKIAAHYLVVSPGYRTSEPHAESLEEEFVFVIAGEIDLWLNGKIKTMSRGDCIGFPAGTGVGHCFINNSEVDCELFVAGNKTIISNRYHFHLDPSLATECGDKWWDDIPKQDLYGHNGLPGKFDQSLIDIKVNTLNGFDKIPSDSFSYPNDTETFSYGVCLSRPFGMKKIAIWLEKLVPGKRSSWPHAHSVEEEFVFILQGTPDIYLDGTDYKTQPNMGIDFKAGSGVSHTIQNKIDNDIYYLCVGECEAPNDKIYYPEHPLRNIEMREKGLLWDINSRS